MADTGLQSTEAMLIRALIRTMGSMNTGILTLTEATNGPEIDGEKGMNGTSATKAVKAAVGVDATNMADQVVMYSPSRLACLCPFMQPWRGMVRSTLAEG